MRNRVRWTLCALFAGLTACGGAPAETETSADVEGAAPESGPAESGVVVRDTTLTTAVDSMGTTATAPPAAEFLPDTETVYLIAELENLPPESAIEVHRDNPGLLESIYKKTGSVTSVISCFKWHHLEQVKQIHASHYWQIEATSPVAD